MSNICPKCSFCGQVPANGFYDGLFLQGRFICSLCEKKLLAAGPDELSYAEQIQNIRAILFAGRSSADKAGLLLSSAAFRR